MKETKETKETGSSLRETISELAESLINDLKGETLTPMEKLAFLKALLPYAVGKLPNVAINYDFCSGQPTSARIIEPTPGGGKKAEKSWLEFVNSL